MPALVLYAFLEQLVPGGNALPILVSEPATREFYATAGQVIPTLLVALAIEMRPFVKELRRILDRGGDAGDTDLLLNPPLAVLLGGNLILLAFAEWIALSSLQDCANGVCADEAAHTWVLIGLATGAGIVFAGLVLALTVDE